MMDNGKTSDVAVGALLESAIDDAFEGVQIIGRDYRYLYVNQTVANQGKKKKKELLGRTMTECYPGIEKTMVFSQIQRCMNDNISLRMENEFVFPDATRGWFQLHLSPCKEGVLIFSVDITDRKQLEELVADKVQEVAEVMQVAIERDKKFQELKKAMDNLQKPTPAVLPEKTSS